MKQTEKVAEERAHETQMGADTLTHKEFHRHTKL